jgi:hypothetical protein
LAVVLSRASDSRHGVLMRGQLREIGSDADSIVYDVLNLMAKKDPNEWVAAMAGGS